MRIDRQFRGNENRLLALAAKRLEANAWRPRANPWVIAITVTLATFKEALDSSIANAVVLPFSGWIANRIGRKRFYSTCVALITVTSLLCGLAPTLGVLVLCRLLHGTADGGLQPSEQSVPVDTLSPQKHSMAFAVYTPRLAPEHKSDELGWQSELIKKLNDSQRLAEIGDQIFLVLDPDRQPHQTRRDAKPLAILVTQRGVRGAGRMRGQRFHAAQRLCIQEQLERAEEAARSTLGAQIKAHHRTEALLLSNR
jgi:hypothetical protein